MRLKYQIGRPAAAARTEPRPAEGGTNGFAPRLLFSRRVPPMTTKTLRGAVAALALGAPLFLVAAPADAAAPYFSSCDNLTHAWPNGVAKSRIAASRAVRDGYSRPATSRRAVAVYWENYRRLDRDRDGTACEN
jgi:hypothetical protein